MARSLLAVFVLTATSFANATETVPVVLAEPDNVQDLPFFVAIGAGYFRDEGLTITIESPDARRANDQAAPCGYANRSRCCRRQSTSS